MKRRSATIAFRCRAEDAGVIAEPVPARTVLPGWLRRLPGVDPERLSATNDGLTVKRCMPFLDALGAGWILPLAATVRLEISDGGRTVNAGWEFDREMVSTHAPFQVAGNPFEPRPPMKFHNHWTIRTAPGWSCLFLPPLNRPNDVVQLFAGLVDTDVYTAPVNLPFIATGADGVHTLPKGTPLVQVVPFRRDTGLTASIGPETDDERDTRRRVHRNTQAGDGWYRRMARARR
ncbi:DUF6065 family protein [Pseudonocardia sp. CA-142604]|uniref:DUF6065 family protein n=1 Tax=Pseudonocardia sp. CA-142604 TaxID=3240024 RepID=UPI003D94FA92